MSTAKLFFQELVSASPTINVVVHPDPNSESNLLISPHDDLQKSVSVPTNYIQSATENGQLVGLPSDFKSVDLNFKKEFLYIKEVKLALDKFDRDLGARTPPVDCYDSNGNKVDCPQ